MKYRSLAPLFFLIAMGCSSTENIISSWNAENVKPRQFKKILVLAIIKETHQQMREEMETHFVGDLSDVGYSAITSMSAFGGSTFLPVSEDSVDNYIKNTGADAVMTIVLLEKTKERDYISGRLLNGPLHDPFGTYYLAMNNHASDKSFSVTDTKYSWESNLYDVATKQLLYSALIQYFSPSTSNLGIIPHHYGKLIVIDMINKKVL